MSQVITTSVPPPERAESPDYFEIRGTMIVSLHPRSESAEEAENRRRKRKRHDRENDRRRNAGLFG